MKIETISYSIQNILTRKTRSFLTIISILIGMMAVFALVSFGLGIQNYIQVLKSQSGGDKLFLQAASSGAPGLDENFFLARDDIDFVGKINGVKEYAEMYFKVVDIKDKDETKYVFITGYDPKKGDFLDESFTVEIIKGRRLKSGDMNKAVLGYNYQFENKIFSKAVALGDKILIKDVKYEIVGFYSEVGNPNDDANIYISIDSFEQLFPSVKDKFSMVMLRSEPGVDPTELADTIEEKLRKRKGQKVGEEDFYVQSFDDALETFGAVIGVLNGILYLISLISVIVAAVNIMNTMYTAVLERTKEIGLMKAIGARNSEILSIFVFESGLLGLIGGVVGVFFGYLIASFGGIIAAASGYALLKPIFPWQLVLACVFFAFLVGAVSGLLPARQASKLKPVDALRYE